MCQFLCQSEFQKNGNQLTWHKLSWLIIYLNMGKQWLCNWTRPHFYQTRSAWSVDQGSNKNHSPAYNFTPTVTKFCVMWEGLSLPHDTKFGNCRCKIVDSRSFHNWSLIHGLRWSGLIKVGPDDHSMLSQKYCIQGPILSWFESYMSSIIRYVICNSIICIYKQIICTEKTSWLNDHYKEWNGFRNYMHQYWYLMVYERQCVRNYAIMNRIKRLHV